MRSCVLRFIMLALAGACLASGRPAQAQTDGVLPLNDPTHHFLERQKTLGHLPDAFVSTQPLSVYSARTALDSLAARDSMLTLSAQRTLDRLRGVTPGPGTAWANRQWGVLYQNGRDLFSTAGDGYRLQANPWSYFTYGTATGDAASSTTWRNSRGVRVSGYIGEHLFFEARASENQRQPPTPIVIGEGATVERLGFVNPQVDDHYDYFRATGLVGYRSKFFEVRFGRDRNRWGPGMGSLMLSNYATEYDQLQIRTNVWRLQYTNLFARFTEAVRVPPQGERADAVQPTPYGTFHRLALNVTDRFQIELFESVIFATEQDSTVSRQGFDVAYLNPVIFYRAVERELGSPDNALVGIGGSWVTPYDVRLYGQFLLDELLVDEIGNQWWGNKWGWMLGAHLANTGVPHLSARAEVARLRPYLYAHVFPPNAYVHYGDVLGYPSGPNSIDTAFFLDYRPPGRLEAELNVSYTRRGRNTETENFGADPTRDSDTRVGNRGIAMLQGVQQTQWLLEGHVSWELLPHLFVDGAFRARLLDDDQRGTTSFVNPSLGLRWGVPFTSQRY
jgi:hypothetical protein